MHLLPLSEEMMAPCGTLRWHRPLIDQTHIISRYQHVLRDAHSAILSSIQTRHHLILGHGHKVLKVQSLALENFTSMGRDKTDIQVRSD